MGVSTDGLIAYGIALDEGEELDYFIEPEWDVIMEEWRDKEFVSRGFEAVNYCTYEVPMYFLAVPGTVMRTPRGYPKKIDSLAAPQNLEHIERWRQALEDRGIDTSEEGWYLFSFWSY